MKNALGKLDEAIADYDKAIRLDPDDARTYYNRGNANISLGRYNLAISDYDEAIQLNLISLKLTLIGAMRIFLFASTSLPLKTIIW